MTAAKLLYPGFTIAMATELQEQASWTRECCLRMIRDALRSTICVAARKFPDAKEKQIEDGGWTEDIRICARENLSRSAALYPVSRDQ
jgi:hypothetical protein